MPILASLLFIVMTAIMAGRKGYNPLAWAFAAGCVGLVVLAFLPFANDPKLTPEVAAAKTKLGTTIGWVLSGISLVTTVMVVASS